MILFPSRVVSRSRCSVPCPSSIYHSRVAKRVTARLMSDTSETRPIISAGEDEAVIKSNIDHLLQAGWTLSEKNELVKSFHFKTYTKVLDLHQMIGVASKAKNHHSIMTSEYGSLTVIWTTHQPKGLSEKDVSMAQYCDEQAKLIGTVDRSAAAKCGPPPSSL